MPAGHGMRSRTRDLFSRPETTSETTSTSRYFESSGCFRFGVVIPWLVQLGIGNNEEREWVCAIKALQSETLRSVVAGSRNSLVICDDGKVFTWGWNQKGTLGHPLETKTETSLSGSYWRGHCLAVDDQGMTIKAELMFECVVFWFYPCGNEYGQCGEEPERKDDTGMPLKRDIIIPQRCASKLSVRQPLNALCLSGSCWRYALSGAYSRRTCLDLGSTMATWRHVYGWGRGEHWRLGFRDDKSSKMVPQRVQLLVEEDIIQVSCGGTHSVARTRDGRMFLFGRGDHGRLGYGRKVSTGHPSEVPINLPAPKNLSGGEDVGAQSLLLVVAITR
ncbi:hypothetical protein RHMOL_Rhmol12G0095200 [Rhododendron molle]|uniref:Uncharacterized protein n=1 Tax=Rhododendron molle TaxID=49168 RepID=A0ACC0LHQ8_RHOML|nr:hypothetical protein RHMOL_Rhmol12G0095200 [Rhododendron molle]